MTSVESPATIEGHPRACARVGAANEPENQRRTGSRNAASGSGTTSAFYGAARSSDSRISRALETAWGLVAAVDKYIVEQAPWKLAKGGFLCGKEGKNARFRLRLS